MPHHRYALDDSLAELNADLQGVTQELEAEREARAAVEAQLEEAQAALAASEAEIQGGVAGLQERAAASEAAAATAQGMLFVTGFATLTFTNLA